MAKPVDPAVLDPEVHRLADLGARQLLGMSLDRLVSNLGSAGDVLDTDDLNGLVLAGRTAEEIDRRESGGTPNAPAAERPHGDM